MRFALRLMLSLVLLTTAANAADSVLGTDDQKTLYALGRSMATSIGALSLSESELEAVKAGLTDGVLGHDSQVPLETYGPKVQTFAQGRIQAAAEVEKKAAKEFLDKAVKEKGAVRSESGMIYTEVKAGKGPQPTATTTVKVHYTGTLRDGTVFDSSVERKEPATFALNQVIPCWTEGLQKMKAGGKAKLVCPSDLAYKDRGAPPKILPGAALVFDVELLEIVK